MYALTLNLPATLTGGLKKKRGETKGWIKRQRIPECLQHACIYVAPNCTHVFVCPGMGSSRTFSFWSHDRKERSGLEPNNAALLWADWDLGLELPLIAVTNAEVEEKQNKEKTIGLQTNKSELSCRPAGKHMMISWNVCNVFLEMFSLWNSAASSKAWKYFLV